MTGRDLINDALGLLNVVATGENASADEFATAKRAFNRLVDAWNLEGLMVFTLTRATKVLTSGLNSYTIGSGGDIDAPQPVRLENAAVILSGGTLEYPLEVLTQERWSEVRYKTESGSPRGVFLQKQANSTARGNILLYPVPDGAHTLVLYLPSQLTAMGEYTAPLYLLQGYQRALVYGLAVEMAAQFGTAPSTVVLGIAMEAKAAVKLSNSQPMNPPGDPALFMHRRHWLRDIRSGY